MAAYETFLSSGMFTIRAGITLKAFTAHKGLLASLSPEFNKHVYNEMKEGTEATMNLGDVSEDTMFRFLQWAYTRDYPVPEDQKIETENEKVESALEEKTDGTETETETETEDQILMTHARLYVLAERFNIVSLKTLSFERLKATLIDRGRPDEKRQALATIQLIAYAFANLPKSQSCTDQVLMYLGKCAAWVLPELRGESAFYELLESDPDFVKELISHVKEADGSPFKVRQPACPLCGVVLPTCPSHSASLTWNTSTRSFNPCPYGHAVPSVYCSNCCRYYT